MEIRRTRAALLEIVLAFALIWGLLGAQAYHDGPLVVAGVELQQNGIVEALEGEPLVAEPVLPARWSFALPSTGEGPTVLTAARIVDERPQRILLLGDSMLDELMLRMADYCLENGHSLHPVVWYGAGTAHWAGDHKLSDLLTSLDPTFVVVVLGSNELTHRHVGQNAVAIRRIVDTIGERPFLWVGPPNWQRDTGINELIARAVGPGRYFRSADLDLERKADGIHPTRRAAARWMDAIADFIVERSDHPIVLRDPSGDAPRPIAKVFAPPGR